MRTLAVAFACALLARPAAAADVSTAKTDDGTATIIKLSGQITEGDTERLTVLLGKAAISGDRVAGIWLDSPGGNIAEGVKLAALIHEIGMVTVVARDTMCASACFLPFAAGSSKYVSRSAHVGVHSAVDRSGQEDVGAMAATVVMARTAALYGVPTAVIGAMVNTLPSRITWLSEEELGSMGVVMSGPPEQRVHIPDTSVPTAPNASPPPAMMIPGAKPSAGGYETLTGTLVRSQCHMDSCFWFSIESGSTVFDTVGERVLDLKLKLWTADYPDRDYSKRVARRFERDAQSYVICSRSRPQVIDGDDTGGWMKTGLAPGDKANIYGYMESSLSIYWAACHGRKIENVYDAASLAQELNYPATAPEGSVNQSQIERLPQIWFSKGEHSATVPP